MAAVPRVAVIGGGIGGLTAALLLADRGLDVHLFDGAAGPGGKLRQVRIGDHMLDAGPTVLTMRDVFEQLLDDVGERLESHLRLRPLHVLARHAWADGSRLDLFAELDQTADAIAAFAGGVEARRYRAFCVRAERVYRTLNRPFMRQQRPSVWSLVVRSGWRGLSDLVHMTPFSTLWREIGRSFGDARLQQLFARYATYCGSSPFEAPATLMLIAHLERLGVWQVEGGLHRIATMLATLAARRGAKLHFDHRVAAVVARSGAVQGIVLADGDRLDADAVVFNGDADALARGLLGPAAAAALPLPRRAPQRSLSALTWNLVGATSGFELAHHNVFFSDAYAREFADIAQGHLPANPTVYVCAQDQVDAARQVSASVQRLLCLVNAPARGDAMRPDAQEIRRCEQTSFEHLARCGLQIERRPSLTVTTTPTQFHRLFPGTGGALYGAATHGWRAAFRRPGSRTRLRGLYLAGGSVHPGPGLPMATLSGRMAADSVLRDLAFRTSVSGWRPADTPGGTSTR